jgi:NCS1 family nucleobase:cation symporter-1
VAEHLRGTEAAEREATFGTLPVLRHERVWNFADFTWVNIGLAIATWAFLSGGATAAFVGAERGIAAMIIGNALGVALMALSTVVASGRYGLEQYTALRATFGPVGIAAIVLTIILVIEMGWTSVLAVMFGRATANVANEGLGTSIGPNGLVVTALALVALAVAWVVLARGPLTIRFLNRIVAPGLALVTIVMLVLVLGERSWSELAAAAPLAPTGDASLDFMIAVEFNLATGFSWWPVMGSLARLTTTPRAALWPNMIGIFGATIVAQVVGLLAALALGDSDPTVWMIPLGGALLGVVALVFIAFANITSMASIVYSTCLALRQAGGRRLQRVRWELLTLGFFLLPAVVVFFPGALYDNFLKFVTWGAAAIAPLTGVVLADFFLLRRQRLWLRALYADGPGTPYHFWGGVNPAAFAALAAGVVVYVALTRARVARSGRGAYGDAPAPAAAGAPGARAAEREAVGR